MEPSSARHVKEYLEYLAMGILIASGSGLPSDRHREDLEALGWKALEYR